MPIRFMTPRAIVFAAVPLAAMVELSIPAVEQWGGEWCWAACAEMVFGHYLRPTTQCALVNQHLNKETCCDGAPPSPPSTECNKPCDVGDIAALYGLDGNGLTATLQAGPLDFDVIRAEIAAGRPVEVKTKLDRRDHVIIVRGAGLDDRGRRIVKYNDPWGGKDKDDFFVNLEMAFAGDWWRKIEEL